MLVAGCDWSDRWLDFAVLDRSGKVVGETRIVYAESPDPVAHFREFLAPLSRRWRATVTGIEDVNLVFARALAASGMEVVQVDPARAARHRAALGTAKSDRVDARLIASMTLAGEGRSLVASSPEAQALRIVAHAHRAAVAHRVEVLHALRAALMRIWPAAVSAWPTGSGGLRSGQARAVLAALLSAAGRHRSVEGEAERLHMIFSRPAMLLDSRVEDAEAVHIRHLVTALDQAAARTDALQCPRCPDLPEPLICLGHPAGTTPASDLPAALLALDAERGPAEDARRRADGTGLTDTQTAALLRALAEENDR
ncbi:IS110 family transposase [Streptomyces aculeolatus]|uniref:IS110 family transposase n=1 Tax=Streptomyces aculeolatus TaxID=270689 RepID=UPI001CECD2DB|nr:IS110 family transposase [Streptomyces aculeolatus]